MLCSLDGLLSCYMYASAAYCTHQPWLWAIWVLCGFSSEIVLGRCSCQGISASCTPWAVPWTQRCICLGLAPSIRASNQAQIWSLSHPQPKPGKALTCLAKTVCSSLNPFDHHVPGWHGWHLPMGWLFQLAVCCGGLVEKQFSWLWAEEVVLV